MILDSFENKQPLETQKESPEETPENRFLKVEQEFIKEAGRLEVSLDGLQQEINAMGGDEAFKNFMSQESPNFSQSREKRNLAGDLHVVNEREAKKAEDKANLAGKATAVLMASTLFAGFLLTNDPNNLEMDNNVVNTLFEGIKNGTATNGEIVSGMLTGTGVLGTILAAKGSIENFIKARVLRKKQEVDNLKYAMTGVQPKV